MTKQQKEWYIQWILKRRQTYSLMSIDELTEDIRSTTFHIRNQVESGRYDSDDIFGDYGYVDDLNIAHSSLDKKREAAGLSKIVYNDRYTYTGRFKLPA